MLLGKIWLKDGNQGGSTTHSRSSAELFREPCRDLEALRIRRLARKGSGQQHGKAKARCKVIHPKMMRANHEEAWKDLSRLRNWTLKCQMNFNTGTPDTMHRWKTMLTLLLKLITSELIIPIQKRGFGMTIDSWPYQGQHPLRFHMQNLRTQKHIAENTHMCTFTQQSPLPVKWMEIPWWWSSIF